MRISDHRYVRDVRKYNLAMRLIHHEARTGTIRNWTGLSRRCIRNLFRSYVHGQTEGCATRHRGPSPHMVDLLLQSAQMRANIALLASILCLMKLIPMPSPQNVRREPNVSRGEQLCTAFEMFRELAPDSTITLEHALLLMATLIQGRELGLGKCVNCEALIVIDIHGVATQICGLCSSSSDINDGKKGTRVVLTKPRSAPRVTAKVSPDQHTLTVGQNPNDPVIQHQESRAADRNT